MNFSQGQKKTHIVNYVVAMSFCSECDEESCTTCKQIHRFSGLHGRSAMHDFCVWALSDPVNRNSTFISHNGKSFDTHFVLDYLIKEGNNPKLLMQGGKILSLKLRKPLNITFIDSLSFLNMPLASFTATFDLGDTVKGSFPHLFNHPHNYKYEGPLPDIKFYDPDSLKQKQRANLLQWYDEHKSDRFVFAKELRDYCTADVTLLKAGCMKFRTSFINSTGVDPFQHITIASACMEAFRLNYMPRDIIGNYYIHMFVCVGVGVGVCLCMGVFVV